LPDDKQEDGRVELPPDLQPVHLPEEDEDEDQGGRDGQPVDISEHVDFDFDREDEDEEGEEDETEEEEEPKDEAEEESEDEEGDSERSEDEEGDSEEKDEEKPISLSEEVSERELDRQVTYRENGKTVRRSLREVIGDASLAAGARQKMNQAHELQSRVQGIVEKLRRDPLDAYRRVLASEGVPEDVIEGQITKLATDRVNEEWTWSSLPEEQKSLAVRARDHARLREEVEELRQENRRRQLDSEQQQVVSYIQQAAQLEGLEAEKDTLLAIADEFDAATLKQGAPKSLEVARAAARRVREQRDSKLPRYLSGLSPEELRRLAPELVEKLEQESAKQRLERVRAKQQKPPRASEKRPPRKRRARKAEDQDGVPRSRYFSDYDEARRDALDADRQTRRKR